MQPDRNGSTTNVNKVVLSEFRQWLWEELGGQKGDFGMNKGQ